MNKEEVKEVKVEKPNYTAWNILKKLAHARVMIAGMMGKKSGFNKYGGWSYFELEDIIPPMLKVFQEVGLIGIEGHDDPVIDPNTGIAVTPERYTLTIFNTDKPDDKPLRFTKKWADACTKGQLPIQAVGSESTYMRRYLWLDALEIVENDATNSVAGKGEEAEPAEQKPRMATEAQLKIIKKNVTDTQKLFEWANIKDWSELTAQKASEIISRKRFGEDGINV